MVLLSCFLARLRIWTLEYFSIYFQYYHLLYYPLISVLLSSFCPFFEDEVEGWEQIHLLSLFHVCCWLKMAENKVTTQKLTPPSNSSSLPALVPLYSACLWWPLLSESKSILNYLYLASLHFTSNLITFQSIQLFSSSCLYPLTY